MGNSHVSGPLYSTGGFIGPLTGAVTGNVTGNVTGDITGAIAPVAVAAEHGAGAIGTGAVPATYRWVENGVIITRIKIDLQGLTCGGSADDVIGLAAATPPAYIGRNVVATNGIIFKVEMACIEVPAGGNADVNFVTGSAATDVYDAAVTGASVKLNSGTLAAGTTIQSLVPAITANHYYYLTCGASTAAAYTAGQLIITTYGHPLLT